MDALIIDVVIQMFVYMITSCRLSITLHETGFNETKIESPSSLMMKQIDGSDGLTVTATK